MSSTTNTLNTRNWQSEGSVQVAMYSFVAAIGCEQGTEPKHPALRLDTHSPPGFPA